MKQFREICVLFFVILLIATPVGADLIEPDCNSDFYLDYASGFTLCSDTSSAHSYWTTGDAHNTHSARLAVYILNSSGIVVVSDSSSSSTTFAAAWWTRDNKTDHGHRATSGIISR